MPRRQTKLQRKLQRRAFSVYSPGDSDCRRVYTKDTKAFTDVEALVHYLELYIHELATSGDRQGLRTALHQYLRLRGVL